MNYWPRWVNAIKKRTATLSLMEMGAYDRLLDHYYAEEQPLPADLDECCRIAAALTKDERKAVEKVLAKFFTLEAAGFRNERADEEILLALPKIAAAKANGSKGGRPKGSLNKPVGFPLGNPPATPVEPTPKAPHPHRQKTGSEDGLQPDPPALPDLEGHTPTPAGAACQAMRMAGIPDATPSHPDLLRLLDAGITAQELADTAAVVVLKGKGSLAYVLATVEGKRADAAAKAAVPAVVAAPSITVPSTDTGAQKFAAEMDERAATATKPPAALVALVRRPQGEAA